MNIINDFNIQYSILFIFYLILIISINCMIKQLQSTTFLHIEIIKFFF